MENVRGMCFLRLCCYICKMPSVGDDVGVWYGFVAVAQYSKQNKINSHMYLYIHIYLMRAYLHRSQQHMRCVLTSKIPKLFELLARIKMNKKKTQRNFIWQNIGAQKMEYAMDRYECIFLYLHKYNNQHGWSETRKRKN